MVKQIGIEFVCTGNGGRSPQAQTTGRDYVKRKEMRKSRPI